MLTTGMWLCSCIAWLAFTGQGTRTLVLACLHGDLGVGPVPAIWPAHKAPGPDELFSSAGEKYSNRLLLSGGGEQ